MKRFIITGVLFFVLGAIATLLVFFTINAYLLPDGVVSMKDTLGKKIEKSIDAALDRRGTSLATSTFKIPDEGLPLNTFSIEGAQKKALETAGIDAGSFVITKEMLVCAEREVGTGRVAAFAAGESPTIIEIGKMSPCLKGS